MKQQDWIDLKDNLKKMGVSAGVREKIEQLIDGIDETGEMSQEAKEEFLKLLDFEIEAGKIEADFYDQLAGVFNEVAEEVPGLSGDR